MTQFRSRVMPGLLVTITLLLWCAVDGFAADEIQSSQQKAGDAVTPQQAMFFESKIRPLLIRSCFGCHGDRQQRSGLRLDSRADLLKGGAHGAALVPGEPDQSLLLRAVAYDGKVKMPPTGKLRPEEIAALMEWVRMGAPWPATQPTAAGARPAQAPEYVISPAQRGFWSFRPVKKPGPPPVKNAAWCLSPIDRFILSKLEAKGLKPAPPADRRTLIRRVSFDLIGLPPTPEEVQAFLNDKSANAYETLVDRLLSSPHYGERWGRHWLDLVRYADSNGLDENVAFARAYLYRDYVIDALNRDKPYDLFLKEQLAGDQMPADDENLRNERLTATGFLTLGPKVLAEPDKEKMVMDIVDEQIEVTSKTFLGLTVACARCHNHKFDPIPTKDYYALAGIFKSTKSMSSLATVAMWQERPLLTKELQAQQEAYAPKLKAARAALKEATDRAGKMPAGSARAEVDRATAALKAVQEKAPPIPMAMAVEDGRVENCKVHIRGDTQNLGDEVPRHFVTVVADGDRVTLDEKRSGRLELAEWLTRPDHPLTARVEVNRIWQGHFGAGLVRTSDNFGLLGEPPTHPELLDWLAATFREQGWSIKKMHRTILLSNTYKMACLSDPQTTARAMKADPENRLHWKTSRRRLEAEPFRDAILAISGKLDPKMGGSLLKTPNHGYVTNDQSGNAAQYDSPRRSIYLPIIRNALFDMFQAFDMGDPSMVNARRATTTVAPQALFVMNSPFILDQSKAFAAGLLSRAEASDTDRIRLAYRKVFSRPPSDIEIAHAKRYLADYAALLNRTEPDPAKRLEKAWTSLCQLLFASNEFIYID
jgi:hypothetical protein